MLNELLALERGLVEYGFEPVARHPDLSQLLKGDVVRVRLAADGALTLEWLDGRTRPEIWTLRDGKHNGFPGLKTARGLLQMDAGARADHDARWKQARTPAAKRAEIEHLVASFAPDPGAGEWPKPGHRKRIKERLETLRPLEAEPGASAVPAVFERFLQAIATEQPLLHRLLDALLDRVRNGEDSWLVLARDALADAVPLAFDVAGDFPRDAGDARQIAAVGRALSAQGTDGPGSTGICALTGRETRLLDGNFPQPTLPSLGQTYLFSRNADIRALARYGRNGPSSMPVDADLAGRFSGALAEVTKASRKDKMWRLLPAEAGDGQDLFISFVASAPEAAVARSLTETDEDEDDESPAGTAQATAAASRLVKFWDGIAGREPGEHARILILRTVDPGNRKATYDRSPSVSDLREAARVWAAAMQTAPHWIGWPAFTKARKPVTAHPRVERPLSLVPLSRKLYVRGGRQPVAAPGLPASDALALFLNEGDRPRRARRILRLLLERHTALLVGIASAKLRGELRDFDPKVTAREDALCSAAWMAALVSFIDPERENIMDSIGFKLGQLLSAADTIHAGYCAQVRGGDIPPTLVGNSVFAKAGRDPSRALGVLQMRWKPYHAWVSRQRWEHSLKKGGDGKTEKKDGTSWAVVNAGLKARAAAQLCTELHRMLEQMRDDGRTPDEVFRAELLLGYVAGLPDERKDKTRTEAKEDEA